MSELQIVLTVDTGFITEADPDSVKLMLGSEAYAAAQKLIDRQIPACERCGANRLRCGRLGCV